VLAVEAGGVRSSLCNTMTIPTPQTTPISHEIMMAFVNLHITVSHQVYVPPTEPFSALWQCVRGSMPRVIVRRVHPAGHTQKDVAAFPPMSWHEASLDYRTPDG
jgi:hypothetical protein